MIRLIIVI